MNISITCQCGKSLKVKPEFAGKKVRCPQCQTVLQVPAQAASDNDPLGTQQAGASAAQKATEIAGQAAEKAGAVIRGASSALTGFLTRKTPDGASSDPPTLPAAPPLPPARRSVFEHLTAQKQDPAIVEKVVERVSKILSGNEQLQYIAIQQRPIVNWFPDCIVLTDRRVILYQPKLFGRVDMQDYIWRRISNARLQENIIGSTLTFDVTNGSPIALDYLPKEQARELYRFAQAAEEAATEERRLRKMEEDRAKAGGVQIMQQIGTTPQPGGPVDPVQRLQQLKQLLDAGLLSQAEYDIKRAELIKQL